ncbi:MAG TPA: hypothetical protein PLD20_12970 [Blastocatellia bacterium]|nr:hypothetical protein [Blastocatellia bacterium]HMV87195.1 hypothetical protein [Blastocatellia bacterium]HMX25549.1 hypothetical protein [Blastocatellia bacterium]HMY70283.1 hypothetical protein [Blastocatellia bacterium]HMZ18840.1 hypothetical protein [Blastocatellia bacterium]
MKFHFLNRWFGNSALSRIELLIGDKLAEIALVTRRQADDERTIQKRIDDVDTKIVALKKERQRIENEMTSARQINHTQLSRLQSELADLRAREMHLSQPETLMVPSGGSVTIKTGGE